MKRLVIKCTLLSFYCWGQAYGGNEVNFNLSFRSDLEIHSSDDKGKLLNSDIEANENNELSAKKFTLSWARLDLSGKITEKASYGLQATYHGSVVQAGDAFLSYQVSDMMSVDFGRVFLYTGGFEGWPTPDAIYNYTLAGSLVPVSDVGIRYNIAIGESELKLLLTNANNEKNQQDLMPGLFWYGRHDMGSVKLHTILSYHLKPIAEQKKSPSGVPDSKKTSDTYLSLGVKTIMPDNSLDIEVGHIANTHKKVDGKKDNSEASTYVLFGFMPQSLLRLFLKYESSEQKMLSEKYLTRTAQDLGVEFFPEGKTAYNYHLVYVNMEDEWQQAVAATDSQVGRKKGDKVKSSKILLGATFNI